ncbi:mechanosensitive ion channel family protein [Halomicrobium salinisoli]|uniref:mechanosensitive ion channel family protein n=1 Tax=Halomicrobium salinisoli TaxID=2878391 RepID=UPI001CF0D2F2|nr:mechanosensitive ion channel family protein [Halomicrobium salinisoli]
MQSTGTETATPASSEIVDLFRNGEALLEQLTTARGRMTVTVVVVLFAVVGLGIVLPWLVRRWREVFASRYVTGPGADVIDLIGEYVPTTLSGIALRIVQLMGILGMTLALLIVWGLVDVARSVGVLLLSALPGVLNVGLTAIIVVVGYIASDQLHRAIHRFSESADQVTDHQEEILLRVTQLTLFVTVGAAVMTLWGVDLSGLLVGAGFLGIVVGLAARQTLGSLIAGFVLMFSRPFTIGDWVQIGDQEGIVTDITIFNTRLENFDGEFVVLPNDSVSDSAVTNRSGKGRLRLRTDVGIDYDADPDHAMDVAMDAMDRVEEVADTPSPQVVPKEFGDSAVVLELRYWIDKPTPPRKWGAVSAVVREVKDAFEREGIAIPFPQRTVGAREDGADAQLGVGEVDADGLD